MALRQHDSKLSKIDGGWGAQMGPDLMFLQLEEGYDEGPDNVALICDHQSWGYLRSLVGDDPRAGCLTWTYRQLMRAARDLALAWEDRGIKRGGTLLAFLPVSADWALGFWVAAILELTFVPLDPLSLDMDKWEGPSYPLELLQPTVVLVPTLKDALNFDQLYPQLNIILKIVCHEQTVFLYNDWTSLEPPNMARARVVGAGDKPRRPDLNDRLTRGDRIAVMLFSQESPDHPFKGCPLRVSNIRTALVNQYIDPCKRYLVTCPSSSSATLEAAMVVWKRGSAVVFSRGYFDAPMTLSSIELHGCTRVVCTPSHLEELIKDPSRSVRKLDSLESLTVHGGVVSAGLLERGQQALQTQWASSSLTMAEGFGVFGWPGVPQSVRTLDSVGTVLGGSRVKICHVDDQDHILDRGREGLLHIGGDAMVRTYIGDVCSDRRFYRDADGKRWFATNYLATMDRNGLIRPTSEFKTHKPTTPHVSP